ncbi:AARP2CN domain-containing protein [Colletotrichum abscissum]|uniref:AARP2CN domain-containing protein n=2 Tax=Colletotrichum acutatum species complex TaxID=2707335 RepID=A0A9P9XH59_9PEZI|nr:AARP2CN domain-containing protein [Colletotrichum lupini]XP_060401971.1 AARP2CN domain-containing protein [Colletotrichum abscissum]KAI3554227.1 AARP2CN domain-containing protein [Colletotrichum abscissum]KAK1507274.1 AARP2CN domain-containing protein [Colletotrichum abscissum]UQC75843.1 AARP2CN domain-containing protein [Colletotrichum lupini]
MEDQVHKPHRKAKDKKGKQNTGEKNPKAFAFSNPGKLARSAARSSDIKERRFHVPQVDRLPDEPPPRLVTIVGPPGVGKTTLLKSLIRRYAKETVSDPQGPITVVTSKKQRLTFVECPNELEAMVDMAKIADIVLLMIDGNYGFEMETMEFLNILAATGMPGNVFGILTHLDLFRKPQALRDAKKRLKKRLWSELYAGAHLFYLSGVMNGRYPDREIHNLSRFLSVMKNPRPLIWRNSHPYTIIDSYRDITHPTKIEEDPMCDRSIVLSGYLRGTNMTQQGQRVHVPGLGDFTVANLEVMPDPCPTPAMEQALAKVTGKTTRRRLDEKEKKLYAPMSDRSGLKIDGDAIWITREKGFTLDKDAEDGERGEGEELIVGLQGERKLLGQTEEGVQLFRGGEQLKQVAEEEDTGRKTQRHARFADRDEESDAEMDDDEGFVSGEDEGESDVEEEFNEGKLGKMFRKTADKDAQEDDIAFADSDSDLGSISGLEDEDEDSEEDMDDEDFDSDEEAAAMKWKENMAERAKKLHGKRRSYHTPDLARFMYDEKLSPDEALQKWRGEDPEEEDIEADEDDDFFQKSKQDKEDKVEDRSIPVYDYQDLAAKWSQAAAVEALRKRFTTAGMRDDDGDDDDEFDGIDDDEEDEDDEGDGVFEDLETGEQHGGDAEEPTEEEAFDTEREKNAKRKEELKLRFEEEDREGFMNDKANARREGAAGDQEFGEDDWYEAQKAVIQKQLDINKAEFETLDERQRAAVEGYRAGKYAKIVLEGVPAEFVEKFNPRNPIIIGGLSPTEDRFGFVQVRIKKHRWHKKILKSNDPLIFSLGWRRFQTMPIYSTSDSRTRNRMLKYTPEHTHCFATVYGPLIAPSTGFVCFNSFSPENPGFRIAATGTVLSVDESTEIVKKLKLTGTADKIHKNTAFIKGMFNTALEIAKFEGAAIKTVSGVRGQIKRALSKPEGHFRATFEDKILYSDIVFLRAWYPIKPHRFYNPVTNLVGWQAMRLTGQVRRDEGIDTPLEKNSQYRKIERQTRHFNPLRVPRALAAELPFKSQIVQQRKQKKETYMQKRAVVLNKEEKTARNLLQQLSTIRNDKVAKRAAKKEEKRAEYRKKIADSDEKKEAREKKESKEFWRKNGRKRQAADDGGGGGGQKRSRK